MRAVLDINLILAARLYEQGFKIKLETDPLFNYIITSPEGPTWALLEKMST
jgi:hypothetical protein